VGGTAPYTYAWNFGDGNPDDTNEIPIQVWDRGTFTNPDNISVTLTVSDSLLATAIYTASVVVVFNE
jgi:PKD repeat protein